MKNTKFTLKEKREYYKHVDTAMYQYQYRLDSLVTRLLRTQSELSDCNSCDKPSLERDISVILVEIFFVQDMLSFLNTL